MDRRSIIVFLLAALPLAGCRSGGSSELLERQLRMQEDRIYMLEDELKEKCQQLQKCEEQRGKPKQPSADGATQSQAPSSMQEASRPRSATRPAVQQVPPELPPIEVEVPEAFPSAAATVPPREATQSARPPKQKPTDSTKVEGWDVHPKSDLRLLPNVSTYRTKGLPLNPPPGEVHARLASQRPTESTPLPTRSPAPASQPNAIPRPVAQSQPPALVESIPPASASQKPPPIRIWSAAVPPAEEPAHPERLTRTPAEHRDVEPATSPQRGSEIPAPPRRRPAWTPYR